MQHDAFAFMMSGCSKRLILLFFLLFTSSSQFGGLTLSEASSYITHLEVSLNAGQAQQLQAQGYTKVEADLNKGCGGKFIYFWYKKGDIEGAITRLQFSFNDEMQNGLNQAGYTKVHKDLNAGAEGDYIFLWYYKGSGDYDVPIVDIDVTVDASGEAAKFTSGWERLACDLNRKAGGRYIHAWVKRAQQTYVCDVAATNSFGVDLEYFNRGYVRLDEDTNRGAGGAFVFVWYRQCTDPQRAISSLKVSTDISEYPWLQDQHYQAVSVDLNQGTGGSLVFLWFKRDEAEKPIKGVTLLFNQAVIQAFQNAGAEVIRRNLNAGNEGWLEYLSVSV